MEHNNCICDDSNYCLNSFDEFIKCKNYNSFQNFHPMIKLINNQNFDHSENKDEYNSENNIKFNIKFNKDVTLIKFFLNICDKVEKKYKIFICIIIFELVLNNLGLVKTNKNFENTIRNKIHALIKESFNEFEDLSKYNNNINPMLTIKRLFDLYFPEK